jgi:hypothetical protein
VEVHSTTVDAIDPDELNINMHLKQIMMVMLSHHILSSQLGLELIINYNFNFSN